MARIAVASELLAADLRRIDKVLRGDRLGVVGDPWFRESIVADMGERIVLLEPDMLHRIRECRAVLIHSLWPDPPSPWEGQLIPEFGPKMKELLAALTTFEPYSDIPEAGGRIVERPLIFWNLEGGNPYCAGTFSHFEEAARIVATSSSAKRGRYAPISASVNIFAREMHLPFDKSYGIVFTGRWFESHKGRCAALWNLLRTLQDLRLDEQLQITEWASRDSWPTAFRDYFVGKVAPFSHLGDFYRAARIGLNHDMWEGGHSMRKPCMYMAGLPTVNIADVHNLRSRLTYLGNRETWTSSSIAHRTEGLNNWRLTHTIAKLLEEAL